MKIYLIYESIKNSDGNLECIKTHRELYGNWHEAMAAAGKIGINASVAEFTCTEVYAVI